MSRASALLAVAWLVACGGPDDGPVDASVPDAAVAPDAAAPIVIDMATDCPTNPDNGAPIELRCTGLYKTWATLTVDDSALAYAPAFSLWSDGAEKSRWLYLPPGSQIDVSDLNEWKFPVGTKLWKEFRLSVNGEVRPVETRLLWKDSSAHWVRVSYLWSNDRTTATQLPNGLVELSGTTHYEVPSQAKCDMCHKGRQDGVLGFEALQLAAPEASGLTWTQLQQKSLVTSSNGNHLVDATTLQVPGAPAERNALGYLHSNCGVACHNPNVPSPYLQRLELDATSHAIGTVFQTSVYLGAVNQPSLFQPPDPVGNYYRIRPTDASHSTAAFRMNLRDDPPLRQMPPITSHVVDDAGVATLSAWIDYMTTANGYPAPAP